MLSQLYIQNYAIIEELTLNLGDNLNIITGETGAGKSILTGALSLILGSRSDSKVLYDQSKKCIVEATFTDNNNKVLNYLKQQEIEVEDDEVIIRRIISTSGKSRAFINDEPVRLTQLKELNALLIDLHRQFDTLGINSESVQREMLDSMSKNEKKLQDYSILFKKYNTQLKELQVLRDKEHSVAKELDFLVFQLQELNEANYQENEQSNLEESVNMMQNMDHILQALQKTSFVLNEKTNSIISEMDDIISDFTKMDAPNKEFEELATRIESTREELLDIAVTAQDLNSSIDSDTSDLETMQERLDSLYRLLRKHNKEDLHELLSFQQQLQEEVQSLQSYEHDKTSLESSIRSLEKELLTQAQTISESRKKVAPKISKEVKKLLAQLGMEYATFEVHVREGKELKSHGIDQIEFLFSANPGKSPEPIKNVASGGELSRLALSLKTVVADNFQLPTLIFDEIDSGISGEVASKMGIILSKLAKKHQLISITHSPQIAAQANHHFFIYKEVNNDRTYTKLKALEHDDRVIEIAKMLSGDPPPQSAIENAKALMG